MGIGTLDDFDFPRACPGDGAGHLRSLISGVGEDALDEGEGTPRPAQNGQRTVPILNVGGMDDDAQKEAKRIDEDVPLAAGDLLARVIALRVKRGAPF